MALTRETFTDKDGERLVQFYENDVFEIDGIRYVPPRVSDRCPYLLPPEQTRDNYRAPNVMFTLKSDGELHSNNGCYCDFYHHVQEDGSLIVPYHQTGTLALRI